jgi:hypothetical protein
MLRTGIADYCAIRLGTMDRDTLICHTERMAVIQPDDEFVREATAFRRASELLEARRKALAPKIAAEVARGVQLARVARACGYTPEHVRRIAREHGVEPAVHREPPPPTRRRQSPGQG